jgi:hypothetical protein
MTWELLFLITSMILIIGQNERMEQTSLQGVENTSRLRLDGLWVKYKIVLMIAQDFSDLHLYFPQNGSGSQDQVD